MGSNFRKTCHKTEVCIDAAGHPLYCMVPMHTAESAKPSTDSCTPGGRSSRPPSDRSSGTQEKARSGKKRASLKRRGSTDLSEMEKEKHERRLGLLLSNILETLDRGAMHPAKPMSRTRPRGPVQVLSFVTGKKQSLPQCLHLLKQRKVHLLRMVLAVVQKGIESKFCSQIKEEYQGSYK